MRITLNKLQEEIKRLKLQYIHQLKYNTANCFYPYKTPSQIKKLEYTPSNFFKFPKFPFLFLFFFLLDMTYRQVPNIQCTSEHTLCISEKREVYMFGKATFDERDTAIEAIPTKIPNLTNIQAISVSSIHSLCLDYDGNVFSFGSNKCGQLGLGVNFYDLECTTIPQKVDLPPIRQISCGFNFSMCVSDNNTLYSFGSNYTGQLGITQDEDIKEVCSPHIVKSLEDIDFIECGGKFCICKTLNNELYGWGENTNGQLGIGNINNHRMPFKIDCYPSDILDIKCGLLHTLVLTSAQEVYSCGYTFFGAIGRELDSEHPYSEVLQKIETLSEIVRIECGYVYSMCIDTFQNLYVFGDNASGQLGVGSKIKQRVPIKHPLSNIIDISSGGLCTFVKTSDDEIYAFGRNSNSQLGIERSEFCTISPIQVLKDKEHIWYTDKSSRIKSARK